MGAFILYLYLTVSTLSIGTVQAIEVNSYDECLSMGHQAIAVAEGSKFACVARG